LAGILAVSRLPVSALPQVDFPTISVQAQLPGASPETVATSVASPLERYLGKIATNRHYIVPSVETSRRCHFPLNRRLSDWGSRVFTRL
jgi:Cu/Ag efflux pump CusA